MKNLIFLGGIHGSGKNHLIENSLKDLSIEHLTASEVLKWDEFSDNPSLKKVNSIKDTQEQLVGNLKKLVKPSNWYILDGHYTLLNKNGDIERVPEDTFLKIAPKSLYLKVSDASVVHDRLNDRDNINWNKELIDYMQQEELAYATYLANSLNIRLNIIKDNESALFAELVKKDIQKPLCFISRNFFNDSQR